MGHPRSAPNRPLAIEPRGSVECIAERALGHVIGGVRGVYDRHEYLEEKRIAFEKLATVIAQIVDPKPNVVAIRGRG